jgi:hypothetical protein
MRPAPQGNRTELDPRAINEPGSQVKQIHWNNPNQR